MLLGFVKSSLCKWLKKGEQAQTAPKGNVIEMDGLWTRTEAGEAELKVVRDDEGQVNLAFGSWLVVVEGLYRGGLEKPRHIVSDGDKAIEGAISFVYGSETPHQLCQFHLLQEYQRNIGKAGFAEAKALLNSRCLEEAYGWAQLAQAASGGKAGYWCEKALAKGLTFLQTGQERLKTTSRLERLQRELRRRERLGTRWLSHNLVILLNASLALSHPK